MLSPQLITYCTVLFIAQPTEQSGDTVLIPIDAQFGVTYNDRVNDTVLLSYKYEYNHTEDTIVRVTSSFKDPTNSTDRFPLFIVTRQETSIDSWSLPFRMRFGKKYSVVSRSLCSYGQVINDSLPLTIQANTYSKDSIELNLRVEKFDNFTLTSSKQYEIYIEPSYTVHYQYSFEGSENLVTLNVTSSDDMCAFVSVQPAKCPVLALNRNIESSERYQTFNKQAAIKIDRTHGDTQYIVFVVDYSNVDCNKTDNITHKDGRMKKIEFIIETDRQNMSESVLVAVFGFGLVPCVFAVVIMAIHSCCLKRFVEKEETYSEPKGNERAESQTGERSGDFAMEEDGRNGSDRNIKDGKTSSESDIETKLQLYVSDLSRKKSATLGERYARYASNLVFIAIYYAVPVIQIVLTHQRFMNDTGNQDSCYYNFLCAHPYGPFHNFNNMISNVPYMILGIFFMIVTAVRQKKCCERWTEWIWCKRKKDHGIPPHYGIYYAMGTALVAEGVMSGCYHVCPSYTNFQFDMAFMYIIGGLMILRLYQSRHPDINVQAYVAYLGLSGFLLVSVVGVIDKGKAFWSVLCIYVIIITVFACPFIMFHGFISCKKMKDMLKSGCVSRTCCGWNCREVNRKKPFYKGRFILVVLILLSNVVLAIIGVIVQPSGQEAIYILCIIIVNFGVYLVYYFIMKCVDADGCRACRVCRECCECKLSYCLSYLLHSSVSFTIIAGVSGGIALHYFKQRLTDWQVSAANSRNGNQPCIMLDYFDSHDVWHFTSAIAVLCLFLAIFHLDDTLAETHRTKIPVF